MAYARSGLSSSLLTIAGALHGAWWGPAAVLLGGGAWVGLHVPLCAAAVAVAAIASTGLVIAGRRAARDVVARLGAGLLVAVAGLAMGAHALVDPPPLDLPLPMRTPPVHEGVVADDPAWTEHGHRFTLDWHRRCPPPPARLGCTPTWGQLRVQVRGKVVAVRRGDVVRIAAFVTPPPGYGNTAALDLRQDWARQQRWGSLHVAHAGKVAILAHSQSPVDAALDQIARWRRTWAARIAQSLPTENAAIVNAMALGDQSVRWPVLDQWLRDTGTAHVLAVSGSHLAIVVGGLRWLLRALVRRCAAGLLRRHPLPLWTALPLLVATWGYTALTGFAPATIRSAWMLTAAVLAEASARRVSVWELLGFAAVCVVVVEPAAVDDLGVQLSLAGVAGLAWAALTARAPTGGAVATVRAAWRCAVGAWAATTPICALRLGQIAWCSAPINLVLAPYAAVLLPACLVVAVGVALPWPPVNALAVQGCLWALWPWTAVVRATAGGFAVGATHGGEALALAAWSLAVGGAALHGGRWLGRALLAAIAVAVVSFAQRRALAAPEDGVRVTLFDVGHGDAIAIQSGDGQTWLVDGGGQVGDDGLVGQVALVPALRALGIDRIDRAVLTHAHPDHENGLLAVARSLPVGQFWFNGQPAAGAEHRELLQRWGHRRTAIPASAAWLDQGPLAVRVLWPAGAASPWVPDRGHNDNSLVLELAIGRARMLLSGDIEAPAEADLVRSGRLRGVDVLKVPHHGSHTSSTQPFLDAVRPRLGVAGARPWGQLAFPHGDVRARYRAANVALWSTADGAVTVTLRPQRVEVQQGARYAAWTPSAER